MGLSRADWNMALLSICAISSSRLNSSPEFKAEFNSRSGRRVIAFSLRNTGCQKCLIAFQSFIDNYTASLKLTNQTSISILLGFIKSIICSDFRYNILVILEIAIF